MKRAIAAVVIMLIALPAQAHTEEELESWLAEYKRMKEHVEVPPWPSQAHPIVTAWDAILVDMQERHPCSKAIGTWTEACNQPVPTHTHSGSSSGSSSSSSAPSGNRGMGNNVEQWRPLVAAYFSADKVDMALCVMAGESGGNPNAKNRNSSAAGLMQFLKSTWDKMVPSDVTGGSYDSGQVYDPEANIRAAAWLQAAAGWSQWNAAARC